MYLFILRKQDFLIKHDLFPWLKKKTEFTLFFCLYSLFVDINFEDKFEK